MAFCAVTATDGMTADSFPFDHGFLAHVAARIVNEVPGGQPRRLRRRLQPAGTIEGE